MATIIIGSARIDENGKATGGAAGDQKQTSSTNDMSGEVSMQAFYLHSKGWYILKPKSATHATKIAERMQAACNNANIGYDQSNRLGVITHGIDTKTKTECDCSSLVRACIKEATGTDPGNFTTATEVAVLGKSGLFEDKVAYVSQAKTPVYNGDVLVTKTSGHTVIVVSGSQRGGTSVSSSLITKLQPAAKKDASLAGTYTVIASSGLKLRYGPCSDKYASMVTMPKGTAAQCYGYYSLNGSVKWLYVVAKVNGKSYTGHACGTWLKKS